MTIKETMKERYPTMTSSEKKIYRLIAENATSFALQPIAKVKEKLGVSASTLVRFAKNLGFEGYSDFRRTLQEEEILQSSPTKRMQELMSSQHEISGSEMAIQECEFIQQMISKLDQKEFNEFISDILQRQCCYVAGWRESAFLAEILSDRLKLAGVNVNLLYRRHAEFAEGLFSSKENDLLIIIDYFPYSSSILQAARYASEKGLKIVLITDQQKKEFEEIANLCFICTSRTDYFLNSMITALFFINLVTNELIERKKDVFLKVLQEREKIYSHSAEVYR
ncbi:MurR/RpiR family transcriptional regulator [Guggenheimella bovis]